MMANSDFFQQLDLGLFCILSGLLMNLAFTALFSRRTRG